MRVSTIFACFALAGSTATAAAQKTTTPAPKKVTPDDTCTTVEPGRVECRKILERGHYVDSVLMKRAALGVQVSGTSSSRDTLGLFVTSVNSKGPAESAGIVEGDRLVSINGVDLRVPSADIDDDYASGLPARRLQREVAKLSPGTRVNVRVYSGGRIRDVQVTTGRASDFTRARTMIGFGDGPAGNMRIFRDGFDVGPIRIREWGPEFEKMRMTLPRLREAYPKMRIPEGEWRKMQEMLPDFRRMELEQFPMLEGGRVYRLRDRDGNIRKLEIEREREKADREKSKKK